MWNDLEGFLYSLDGSNIATKATRVLAVLIITWVSLVLSRMLLKTLEKQLMHKIQLDGGANALEAKKRA